MQIFLHRGVISYLSCLFTHTILKSFDQIRAEYSTPATEFFKYHVIKHYIQYILKENKLLVSAVETMLRYAN